METRTPNRLPFHQWVVFPMLLAQGVVVLLAALVLWQWLGAVSGYSGLCGGLIAWLPNLYFAWKAFRFTGARAAQAIVRSFYAGEAGKLILTAVLFALDVRRSETTGAAGCIRRLRADPAGQLVRTPAHENKTFETLGRLRQPWQKQPLRAISSTTCRT